MIRDVLDQEAWHGYREESMKIVEVKEYRLRYPVAGEICKFKVVEYIAICRGHRDCDGWWDYGMGRRKRQIEGEDGGTLFDRVQSV